jgi:hypothetical protein
MGLIGLFSKSLGLACAIDSARVNLYAWAAQWTFQQGESHAIYGYVQKRLSPLIEILASNYVMNHSPSAAVLNGMTYMFYENNGALYYASCTPGMSSPDTEVPTITVPSGIPSPVVFNGDLYVFYESVGQLAYSVFNGATWSSGIVSGTAITESPSAVVYNKSLYVFYQGTENSNGNLWYSVFDGTSWSTSQKNNVGMSASPSVVIFNSNVYVFHQGGQYCGQLWYSVLSGTVWSADTKVANVGMSYSPSAVIFNNQLYVVHQGSGNNGQLWYNTFDGTSWAGDKQVSGVVMQDSPYAMVMNNEVWIICPQAGNAGTFAYFELTNSSTGGMVPAQPHAYGPSIVTYNGLPYLFYLGPGSVGRLWYNVCVGPSHWTSSMNGPNLSQLDPSAASGIAGFGTVVFNNEPYVFFNGNGQLWYSVFTQGAWNSKTVPNVSIGSFPWPVVYNNELYVFYTASSSTGISYVIFDGSAWSSEVTPSSFDGTSDSPAAVVYAPPGSSFQIYVFYSGTGSNSGAVYYNIFNGSSWTSSTQISDTNLSYSPSAVVFNGEIYLVYEGSGGDAQLRYNTFNGSTWSGYTQVTGVSTYNRPWPVVSDGQLLVFYHSAASAGGIWYVPLFSSGPGIEVPASSSAYVPAALAYDNAISVFYLANSNSQILYNLHTGNSLWTPPIQGPDLSAPATGNNPGLSQSPSAVLFNNQPFVFYNGDGNLWYSVFNGSSWSSAEVSGIMLSQSPAAVVYTPPGSSSPSIYVFYQQAPSSIM